MKNVWEIKYNGNLAQTYIISLKPSQYHNKLKSDDFKE